VYLYLFLYVISPVSHKSRDLLSTQKLFVKNEDVINSQDVALGVSDNNMTKSKLTSLADPSKFQTVEDILKYYDNALLPLQHVIESWPPEFTDERPTEWVDVVPRFDYSNPLSRRAAELVRDAELPFVIQNVPSVVKASKTWSKT
jgi:hypothetical protein